MEYERSKILSFTSEFACICLGWGGSWLENSPSARAIAAHVAKQSKRRTIGHVLEMKSRENKSGEGRRTNGRWNLDSRDEQSREEKDRGEKKEKNEERRTGKKRLRSNVELKRDCRVPTIGAFRSSGAKKNVVPWT